MMTARILPRLVESVQQNCAIRGPVAFFAWFLDYGFRWTLSQRDNRSSAIICMRLKGSSRQTRLRLCGISLSTHFIRLTRTTPVLIAVFPTDLDMGTYR